MSKQRGKIILFIGPMFSEKTSSMCRELRRHQLAGRSCIIAKYSKDTRYDHLTARGGIMTHSGEEFSHVEIVRTSTIADVFDKLAEYDVIGIDEAQFMPDCPEFANKLANMGKLVVCSALDATFEGKPFGNILDLVPVAEKVVKRKAICVFCGCSASFSKRTTADTQLEVIGGADMYSAACRKCFYAPMQTSVAPNASATQPAPTASS